MDRFEGYIQHRVTDWADGYFEVSVTAFDETDISLDEAWLRVVVPWGSGLTLMGGVYDCPIGIGANENIDIWNWQFKMVDLLVAPWSITGGRVEYEIGELVNINFWIGNGWGYSEAYGVNALLSAGTSRTRKCSTVAGSGSARTRCSTSVSAWSGRTSGRTPPIPGEAARWSTWTSGGSTCRTSWAPWTSRLWWLELTDTPLGEGLYDNSQAYGGVAQFNFKTPMESLSVSLAYEAVWDENGIVFGGDPNGMLNLTNQTRQSVEVTPIWALGDHVIVALTWRSDWSNKDVMTNSDGNPTDFAWLTAWEWYYYF